MATDNNKINAESILAKTQERTDASLANIKKLNRSTSLFTGLSAVDSFRKEQAVKRAELFYSSGSSYLTDHANVFNNAVSFWSAHDEKYKGTGDWEAQFWVDKTKEFFNSQGGMDYEAAENDKTDQGITYANQMIQNLKNGDDPDATNEFLRYKSLHDLYSNENLRPGQAASPEEISTMKERWSAGERKKLLDQTKKIAAEGGLLNDVSRILGIDNSRVPENMRSAYTDFEIPENVSEETRRYMEGIIEFKQLHSSVENERRSYSTAIADPSNVQQFQYAYGGQGGGYEALNTYDNKNVGDFVENLVAAEQDWFSTEFPNTGEYNINVDGTVMNYNQALAINKIGTDGKLTRSVNSSGEPQTLESIMIGLINASEPSYTTAVENMSKVTQQFANFFLQAGAQADTDGNQELATQYRAMGNNPSAVLDMLFDAMPAADIFGIESDSNGEIINFKTAASSPDINVAQHRIMSNAVSLYSYSDASRALATLTNLPGFRMLPDQGFYFNQILGESLLEEQDSSDVNSTVTGDEVSGSPLQLSREGLIAEIEENEEKIATFNNTYSLSRTERDDLGSGRVTVEELAAIRKDQIGARFVDLINNVDINTLLQSGNLFGIGNTQTDATVSSSIRRIAQSNMFSRSIKPTPPNQGGTSVSRTVFNNTTTTEAVRDLLLGELTRPEEDTRAFTSLDRLDDNAYNEILTKMITGLPAVDIISKRIKDPSIDDSLDGEVDGDTTAEPNTSGEVANILRASTYGLTDNAVAGILGNIEVETGGSFNHEQQQAEGGPGYGLFQFDWHKPYYEEWLTTTDNTDSAQSQVDYMLDNIYGDSQSVLGERNAAELRRVLSMGTAEEIATAFSDIFERPSVSNMQRRIDAAEQASSRRGL